MFKSLWINFNVLLLMRLQHLCIVFRFLISINNIESVLAECSLHTLNAFFYEITLKFLWYLKLNWNKLRNWWTYYLQWQLLVNYLIERYDVSSNLLNDPPDRLSTLGIVVVNIKSTVFQHCLIFKMLLQKCCDNILNKRFISIIITNSLDCLWNKFK